MIVGGRPGARVYDLAHLFSTGMDGHPLLPPFQRLDATRIGDRVNDAGNTAASDVLVTSLHGGTHIDALSHVAGVVNGVTIADQRSAEHMPVFYTRFALIDVAEAAAGGAVEIDAPPIRAALDGLENELAGGVALVRTGWESRWNDGSRTYGTDLANMPGITLTAAKYLAGLGAVAIGADTPMLESARSQLAVHRFLLAESGIYIFENLHLSELAADRIASGDFVAAPPRIAGGSASPVRPLAVVAADG